MIEDAADWRMNTPRGAIELGSVRLERPRQGSNDGLEEKMTKHKLVELIIIPVMVLSLASSRAQEWPVSGFYQIISGGYGVCVEVCGLEFSLPNTNQSYIAMSVDAQRNTAQLAILGEDRHTVFGSFGFTFFLTNGAVFPDHLQFAERDWSYTVSNSAGGLRIDGGFANHPFYFSHVDVEAILVTADPVPMLGLPRVSGGGAIEITVFNGKWGQTNVIEASTDLFSWTAISTNVFPATTCPICPFIDFQDSASTNLARRFYRSYSLP